MKRKIRKSIACLAATVLCLTMLFGVTVQAGSLNPENYFYVSVSMQGVATRSIQPTSAGDFGGSGTIIDWGQVVSAGSTVKASLNRRGSHSYDYPEVLSYTWELTNKSGTYTKKYYASSIKIPTEFAGGSLKVTVNTKEDNTWIASEFGSHVSIG